MKNPILALSVAVTAAACCVSCSWVGAFGPSIEGSGVRATETRSFSSFDAVQVAGPMDVVIEVGGTPSATLSCDDNLLPYVVTEVRGSQLRIYMKNGSYDFDEPLRIRVTAPDLQAIGIAGSGDLQADGVNTGRFSVSIAGSGDVEVHGKADIVDVDIAGSGDMDLIELKSRRATVEIAGSGNVRLSVSEDLDVSIAGSGDVLYEGDPRVKRSIAGSGSVAVTPRAPIPCAGILASVLQVRGDDVEEEDHARQETCDHDQQQS